MKHFAFSPAALDDLDSIWDFTADKWSIEQADNYIEGIVDVCRDLAAGSKTGRPVEIRSGYFKCRIESHVIFYRHNEARIEIIRILHGRMDSDRHL